VPVAPDDADGLPLRITQEPGDATAGVVGLDDAVDAVGSRFLYQCCPALEACLQGLASLPAAPAPPPPQGPTTADRSTTAGTSAAPGLGPVSAPPVSNDVTAALGTPLGGASPGGGRRSQAKRIVPTRVDVVPVASGAPVR
jgi:hypothetical protein